jgi:acetyl-CoA acyltransferase
MSEVYIIGADMIAFGRYPDKTPAQLGGQAALMALDDCGLTIDDVEVFYTGSSFTAGASMSQQIMREIGQTGIPCVNVSNACASGATAVREAFIAVKSGLYDVALAVGTEMNPRGMLGGGPSGGLTPEGIFGSGSMPAVFAECGMVHAGKYGTTMEQFAKIAVKNRKHGALNPKAKYQTEASLEEILGSELIAYPLTKLMCSANVDGAASLVIVSEKKAKEMGLGRAVRIAGSGLASDPWEANNPELFDPNSVTRLAAARAYEMAGMGPEDLDVVELHDCFATAEMLHYENLGLCGEGEAARMIEDGEVVLGGRLPVNVSGGLIAKGHPIGATGVANIVEIVEHLRGEAGKRQVEGARIGLAHVLGFGTSSAVHILQKA